MTQPVPFPAPETTAPMDPEHHQHPHETPAPDDVPAPGDPSALGEVPSLGEAEDTAVSGMPPSPTLVMQQPTAPTTPHTKPSRKRSLPEHPLLAIIGTVAALLLIFTLTQTNDRISRVDDRVSRVDDRVSRVDDRISRLEDKVDAGFAKIDERFTEQDAKFDEINLKLTALIAALNATAEVEAALDGRLLDPNTSPANQTAN